MTSENDDIFGTPDLNNNVKIVIGGRVFTNADEDVLNEIFNSIENSKYTTTCFENELQSINMIIRIGKDKQIIKFNTCINHPDCIFFKNCCTRIVEDSHKIRKYRISNEPQLMTKSLFNELSCRFYK